VNKLDKLVGHAKYMAEMRNAYKIVVRKCERKKIFQETQA
jgi:hypothetical protein